MTDKIPVKICAEKFYLSLISYLKSLGNPSNAVLLLNLKVGTVYTCITTVPEVA